MSESFRHGTLSVTATGQVGSRPVVILHGWGSSAAVMRGLAESLAEDFRVYNVDLPGHGNAPVPPRPLDLADHSDAVKALIKDVIGAPAALVGHSNGGRIALYLASEPDAELYVSRLALVSPSGLRRKPLLKTRIRRAIATTLKAPFTILPGPAREFTLDWLRHSLVWKLLGASDYRALEGVMRDTFVRLVNHFLEDRIRSIHAPILVFWGDRDEDIVREQVDRLVSLAPEARLVVVPQAGHYAFLDRFDLVQGEMTPFLLTA